MTTPGNITKPTNPGIVHVWMASLDVPQPARDRYQQILSDEEKERAGRFVFEKDRAHFTVARGVLRSLLGAYLKIDPAAVAFEYGPYNKPCLHGTPPGVDLSFNLAHSGDWALYAITCGDNIGVEVECIRKTIHCIDIAKRFFSRDEARQLQALPAEQRRQAFFNGWTRKEAFIKAIGMGLAFPLSAFDVTMGPDDEAAILRVSGHPTQATEWTMRAIEMPSRYVGAVVKKGSIDQLIVRHWE